MKKMLPWALFLWTWAGFFVYLAVTTHVYPILLISGIFVFLGICMLASGADEDKQKRREKQWAHKENHSCLNYRTDELIKGITKLDDRCNKLRNELYDYQIRTTGIINKWCTSLSQRLSVIEKKLRIKK